MTDEATNAAANTDRELWREREGDFYADSIHVTAQGGIGIDCGGTVVVLPVREWHRRALLAPSPAPAAEPTVAESHQRIVSGKGTMADYVHVLGDPRVGIASPPESAAPAPVDGLVDRLREFDSYRGRLSFTELKTLDEACAALASRTPPIVSGDEQDAARYRWLAADGDRARRTLTENSGHEVEAAIDAAIAQTKELTP